jgi:hypothetical protein
MKKLISALWNYLFKQGRQNNNERGPELTRKWNIAIQVFIVFVALAGSIYVALAPVNSLMNWYNIDDAFYYYKVAVNVVSGHGFSFDGINLTNGFHPLWMVVCLGVFWLSKINLILPLRVLVIVSGLFNAATAFVLYRLLQKFIHPYAAILGAMVWALLPAIYGVTIVQGMESVISAFFLVLLLYLATSFMMNDSQQSQANPRKMLVLGLVAAFTVLARLDNVFIVGFIGLFAVFRVKRISSALIYDLAALGLAIVSSWILRLGITSFEQNAYSIYLLMGITLVVFPIVYYFFGMYDGFNQKGILSKIIRQVGAGIINFIFMYTISSAFYRMGILKMFSRSVIVILALISFAFIFCLRLIQGKNNIAAFNNPFREFGVWIKSAWKRVLIEGMAYAIPIGGVVGIYCIFNKLIFGTFTPVSGQIKTWWSTLPNTVYSHPNTLISILGLSSNGNYGPWSILTSRIDDLNKIIIHLINATNDLNSFLFVLLTIIFIFLVAAILKADENRLGKQIFKLQAPVVFVGCLFQIAYYTAIGYEGARVWYWVGELLVVALLVSVGLDGLIEWLSKKEGKIKWSVLFTFFFAGTLLFVHTKYLISMIPMQVSPQNENAYLSETLQVESFTPGGSKIGMTGGGMIAYFIEGRTIVNMDGLINSADYFHALKTGTATQFLDAIPLNYVYGKEYVVKESDPYKDILKNRLQEIGVIQGYDNFTLYKYVINQ